MAGEVVLIDPATGLSYRAGSGGASGAQPASGSQSVTPASDGAAFPVTGNGAHNSTVIDNPILIGGFAASSPPTATTLGNRVRAWFTASGAQVVASGLNGAPSSTGTTVNTSLSANTAAAPFAVLDYVWNGTNTIPTAGDAVSRFSRPAPRAKSASAVVAGSTTSQQLFAANATRSRLLIQNQDASINVFVNFGGAAVVGAGSLRINPGATLDLSGTNQSVELIAASGTPAITAWEF